MNWFPRFIFYATKKSRTFLQKISRPEKSLFYSLLLLHFCCNEPFVEITTHRMLRPFPSKQNVSMLRRPYVRPSALTGQRQGDVVLTDDWVTGVGWVDEWEKGIRSERGRWQLSSAHLWRTLIMGLVFCLERDREGRIPPPRLLFCTPSGYGTISTGFETHLLKMLLV